ncbi:MAG TPA: outer membrane beta-barrel protein [Sphingobacteriaceae bacterium]
MKKYTRFFSLATLLLLLVLNVEAQVRITGSKVTGQVRDEQQKPMDFATIILMNAKDSSMVRSAMTDLSGKFMFENLPGGTYKVSANMISYSKAVSRTFAVDENNKQVDLGDMHLQIASKALKEVTVTSTRPFVERKVDRLVVNVEGSSVAAGSTALEVLQKAPGVTVDQDDNISMQGKQGVLVMLDGKQTYMSNADVANLLKGMPSTQIESIELITNPSARYDASGNSGIINIKTKKSKSGGTNGTVTAGAGLGENHRTNAGVSLNHRNNNVNVFGTYNYAFNKRSKDMSISRINSGTNLDTYFGQVGSSVRDNDNNNFKAGVDISLNKKNTLGFMVNGYLNSGHDLMDNKTSIGRSYDVKDSSLVSLNDGRNKYRNMSYNMNYKSELDSLGQELSFDLDYSQYNGRDNMAYDTRYYHADGSLSRPADIVRNGTPNKIDIKAFKVDYTKPLNKTTKMEAGIKSSWVETNNNFRYEQLIGNTWTNDPRRSNHFVYEENVNAAYFNLNKQFKKTSIQAGLRAEQTLSNGNLITTGKEVERSYIDLFPSIFINREFSEKHGLGISYSRRIDRPSYDALNPFEFYLDRYAYSQGNPFLSPQYTNKYELNYTYQKKYMLGLGYSLTRDVITEVLLPDTNRKALFQTRENLNKQINYSVSANAPVSPARWWNSNNNLIVFYLGFRSEDLRGKELNTGKVAFQFNSQHNFVLNKDLTAEVSGGYQAPLQYGALQIQAEYGIDLGLSKTFMNKKASLKVAMTDIFNTRKQRISSVYEGLTYNLVQKHETRVAKVSFSYRFGKNEIKPARRRTTGLEEEQRRMKN